MNGLGSAVVGGGVLLTALFFVISDKIMRGLGQQSTLEEKASEGKLQGQKKTTQSTTSFPTETHTLVIEGTARIMV